MTKELFYSPKEKFLFWTAGYSKADQTDNLFEKMEDLNQLAKIFIEKIGVSEQNLRDVSTRLISKSRRYKYMRIFYIKVTSPPKEAFVLGNGWTMDTWLED